MEIHSRPKGKNLLWVMVKFKDGQEVEGTVKNDLLEMHDLAQPPTLAMELKVHPGKAYSKPLTVDVNDVESLVVLGVIGRHKQC